jgi:glyoxylase-like metal-dependent hydrolase (beta-lactamase superfamily II)
VRELQPGLWHWQSPHPDWNSEQYWPQEVSSYAIDDGTHLLLFDPLAVPSDIRKLAAERAPLIVLTAPWHERDTQSLVEGFGWPVYAPRPDSAEDLIQKYGITAERAGDGSPDLAWLRTGSHEWHPYAAGDRLPIGIEAFPGREPNDLVLWIEDRRAVVSGDTLADFGDGIGIQTEWIGKGDTRARVAEGLRPLLDLPVELVLPAHGVPTDRGALENALS